MSYVYIRSESTLWTVGFYKPDGTWEPESDHDDKRKAAGRCHYLNGGDPGQAKAQAWMIDKLLAIPGMWELVSEEFNNEAIDFCHENGLDEDTHEDFQKAVSSVVADWLGG